MPRSHLVLRGSHRSQPAGAVVLGRAKSEDICEVTLKLRRRAALPEPTGGAVFTAKALTTKYGADPADMKTVASVLANFGLERVLQDPVACLMRFRAPVRAMEKAFGLQLFRARQGRRAYRARNGDIHLPRQLAKIVVGVFGLDTRSSVRQRQGRPVHDTPQPGTNWYLPADLAKIYNFPLGDGAGQTIGLVELGGYYSEEALRKFIGVAKIAALPRVDLVQVMLPDPADPWKETEAGEVMLDIEVVAGICPKATIAVYFSKYTDDGMIAALQAIIRDAPVRKFSALSISFGSAENTGLWTPQAMKAVNDLLKTISGLGITVCAATGDDGSSDRIQDGQAHVDFPASSPYVLAVGGTALTMAAGARHETAWKQTNTACSGGGVSAVFARQPWQTVKVKSVNPQSIDGRCLPDVAAHAATKPGYAWVAPNKAPASDGGTSAAAPLWAAFIARMNAALPAGKRIGFLTPLLYQANAKTAGEPLGSMVCNDIVDGDNITAHAGGYKAAAGYDAVTGWGSPDGRKFLQFLS